jgi:hypothetical protein
MTPVNWTRSARWSGTRPLAGKISRAPLRYDGEPRSLEQAARHRSSALGRCGEGGAGAG